MTFWDCRPQIAHQLPYQDEYTKIRADRPDQLGNLYARGRSALLASLTDRQRCYALRNHIDHLGLALRHALDQEHPPAVQVLAIAHDQAGRDDHVDHSKLILKCCEVEAFRSRWC